MQSGRHVATLILGLTTAGFVLAGLFANTYAGALLASGFGAAMVGGLADWFAVTALFRRPLGISYRTAIIPRNRDRIVAAIVEAVEWELLTPANIRETLRHYDLAALIFRYLEDYDGKAHLKAVGEKVARDCIANIGSSQLGSFLAVLIQTDAAALRLARPLGQALTWTVQQGLFDSLSEVVIDELAAMSEQPQTQAFLTGVLAETWMAYEKQMLRRRIAGQFLAGLGLTPTNLAELAQQQARRLLGEIRRTDHPFRVELRRRLLAYATGLETDPDRQARFEAWKDDWLNRQSALAEFAGEVVHDVTEALAADSSQSIIQHYLGQRIERLVSDFHREATKRQMLNQAANQAVSLLLDTHHDRIGILVRERLEQYSTSELVALIEERVGHDLQMIRINGSIVGGLTGMLIFLITHGW